MTTRSPETGDGFIELWPTLVLNRIVPGHEDANRALVAHVAELERGNPDLTTDYRSGDLLASDNPAVRWLRRCIDVTVRDYLVRAGVDYEVRWSVHGWANVNRFGDYHDPHNHPHAYLSGTYYVTVPRGNDAPRSRADVRPGCISLYDPRSSANMGASRGDPNIEAEHTVRPEPGMILLWPAFLMHFVHPNLAREPRISISFNAMLDRPGDYLPAQA